MYVVLQYKNKDWSKQEEAITMNQSSIENFLFLVRNNKIKAAKKELINFKSKKVKKEIIYLLEAILNVKQKKLKKALYFSNKALLVNKLNSDALNIKGKIITELKSNVSSTSIFKKAISINSNKIEYYINLIDECVRCEDVESVRNLIDSFDINKEMNKSICTYILKKYEDNIKFFNFLFDNIENNNVFEYLLIYSASRRNYKEIYLNLFEKSSNFQIEDYKVNLCKGYQLFFDYDLTNAISEFEKYLSIKRDDPIIWNLVGVSYGRLGDDIKALECYKTSFGVDSSYSPAIANLATLLQKNNNYSQAQLLFKQAIDLDPQAHHYLNMGTCLTELGKHDEGQAAFEKASELNPELHQAHASKLFGQFSSCDWSFDEVLGFTEIGTGENPVNPYMMLLAEDNPRNQYLRAVRFAKETYPNYTPHLFSTKRNDKVNKIRIGIFSADFHDFPGMHLMIGLIEGINRDKFELIAFSYGKNVLDHMRKRLVKGFDDFIDIRSKSDADVASLSRNMSIDIAIHRNGYTKSHRTGIFFNNAAPIQINYLGHPSTLGASFIDYIIADKIVIPQEYKKYYSEKVIFLPNTYQPTNNKRKISNLEVSRNDYNIPKDAFVLCCFNAVRKIRREEFCIWLRVMEKNPSVVLWLLKGNKSSVENLKKFAKKNNISPSRIIFAERVPQEEHLARHRLADLFVDTFIYNAHTTCSDALWAGLPVVTKIGKQFSSRVAASLLYAIDLPELVTKDNEQYFTVIDEVVNDTNALTAIKAKLKRNISTTPLFDTDLYIKNFEEAMKIVYERDTKGEDPSDIYL